MPRQTGYMLANPETGGLCRDRLETSANFRRGEAGFGSQLSNWLMPRSCRRMITDLAGATGLGALSPGRGDVASAAPRVS